MSGGKRASNACLRLNARRSLSRKFSARERRQAPRGPVTVLARWPLTVFTQLRQRRSATFFPKLWRHEHVCASCLPTPKLWRHEHVCASCLPTCELPGPCGAALSRHFAFSLKLRVHGTLVCFRRSFVHIILCFSGCMVSPSADNKTCILNTEQGLAARVDNMMIRP